MGVGFVGDLSDVDTSFPRLSKYAQLNGIKIATQEDVVLILKKIIPYGGIGDYINKLSIDYKQDKDSERELMNFFLLAAENESIANKLLTLLRRGGSHNDEQFIHRIGDSPKLFNAMMVFLQKTDLSQEEFKKLLETYYSRDNGRTYYPYRVYHALQLSNNLDVSTSTLERHIDVLPPSHIEWLASRIRFGWDSFGRDLYHGYTPSQEVNKKVNEHFGSNIAPTTTQNKWHYAKLVRVCVNVLRAIYPKAFAEYAKGGAEEEQDAIHACGDLLHSLIVKYGKGVTNEDVRQVASKDVFDRINLSDSIYLYDTIRDVVVRPYLLPAVLRLVRPEYQESLLKREDESFADKIESKLIKRFAKYLFKSHDVVALSLLTKKAHERLGTIEKTRDIPRQGDRYSFLTDKKIDLGDYVAIPIDNANYLQVEGSRNNTCLGGFAGPCFSGGQHVLVFRDKQNNPLGYVRLSIREYKKEPESGGFVVSNSNLYMEKYAMYPLYLTSPGNKPPTPELIKAFDAFKLKVESGELYVNTSKQGKIKDSESIGSFLNRVGFDWNDDEKIQKNYNILTARNGNVAGDSFAIRQGGGRKGTLIHTDDKDVDPKEFVLKYKLGKGLVEQIEKKLEIKISLYH